MAHVTCADEYRTPAPTLESCLLVVHAPPPRLLGERFQLAHGDLVIGRDEGCDVMLDVLDVSRRHARVREESGRHSIEDLASKNGTLVDERPITICDLAPGALIRVGSVVFKYLRLNDLESLCCAKMKQLANEDALTGLALRGAFADALSRELSRSRRHGHPLSLGLVDIDRFKQVNDQFGHLAGDAVLCQLASCISRMVRREQLLARVGGDELALLLPDVPIEGAYAFAEKIRRVIEGRPFRADSRSVRVTVSIGIAALHPGDPHPDALIARADASLYAAKCAGRNRVFPCITNPGDREHLQQNAAAVQALRNRRL